MAVGSTRAPPTSRPTGWPQICAAHSLDTLPPSKRQAKQKWMDSREYRSAAKVQSGKFRLMNTIDQCMRYADTKEVMNHEFQIRAEIVGGRTERLNQPPTPSELAMSSDIPTRRGWNDLLAALVVLYQMEGTNSGWLECLPTAEIMMQDETGWTVEAEVFGKGIEMCLRSQGSSITMTDHQA